MFEKNPRKNIPRALIYGTIIIAIICILFVVSSLGSLNWELFGLAKAPLANLSMLYYGALGKEIFTILIYLSIIGSVAGWIVSAPRLMLSLAKDKLFITQCAKIHPKNNTPHVAIIFQTVFTSILIIVGSASYEKLLEILLPMVLIIYSLTLLSLVVLRYKKPHLERTYKAPLGKFLPLVVIAMLVSLVVYWSVSIGGAFNTLKLGLSFIIFGVPIYFLLLFYYNPDAIIKVQNTLAYFNLFFEVVFLWHIDVVHSRPVFGMVGPFQQHLFLMPPDH